MSLTPLMIILISPCTNLSRPSTITFIDARYRSATVGSHQVHSGIGTDMSYAYAYLWTFLPTTFVREGLVRPCR
ncbi:hypothetical protein B0H34DRAFT_705374 [Crassisporium funariophilum]|nr:hypothetical protein B0H34DRAFT_705374 [Crassisporium funariophilum]